MSRVLRGGAWNNDAINLRSANRNRNQPDNRNTNIGFRLAAGSLDYFRDRNGGDHGRRQRVRRVRTGFRRLLILGSVRRM